MKSVVLQFIIGMTIINSVISAVMTLNKGYSCSPFQFGEEKLICQPILVLSAPYLRSQ